MIDTDKYEYDCPQEGCGRETTHVEEDYFECRCGWFGQRISSIEDLEKEIKRLHQEINQLPIDLHESLDMILEAHHPEVRESVMSMFGDAWGNNVVGYDE